MIFLLFIRVREAAKKTLNGSSIKRGEGGKGHAIKKKRTFGTFFFFFLKF